MIMIEVNGTTRQIDLDLIPHLFGRCAMRSATDAARRVDAASGSGARVPSISERGRRRWLVLGADGRSSMAPASLPVEGLSPDGRHPVQQGLARPRRCQRCGFCQSGRIMAAVCVPRAKPQSHELDIDANIENCRCEPRTASPRHPSRRRPTEEA